ncbi:MAG TPA: hypothetical protein VK666_17260 [Chryseolinea sp.]|nr:hypothetical protein [Chryseolinea sp.]
MKKVTGEYSFVNFSRPFISWLDNYAVVGFSQHAFQASHTPGVINY